jgi:hypothetical protein
VVIKDQVDGEVLFQHRYVPVRPDCLQQSVLDLGAGEVMGVDDAPAPVSTLLPEIEVLVSGGISVGIEGHAEAEQLSDEPGSGLGHKPDDIRMRYATTGPDRILVVEPGTIIGLDRRGDAALSVVRVRLSILFLGDEQNRSLPARAVREP